MLVMVSDVELHGEVVSEGVIVSVGEEGEGCERGIFNGDIDFIRGVQFIVGKQGNCEDED